LMITCFRSSSRSCISVGKSGKVNNLAATICVSIRPNLAKFGSSTNKEGSALGVVYWLDCWIIPSSKSSELNNYSYRLGFLISSFFFKSPTTCRICILVILLWIAIGVGKGPLDLQLSFNCGLDSLFAVYCRLPLVHYKETRQI
jgi:hypothetical protein